MPACDLFISEPLVLARKDLVEVAVDAVRHLHPLVPVVELDLGVRDVLRRLVGAAHRRRPEPRLVDLGAVLAADRLLGVDRELARVLLAELGDARVAADLAELVVLRLPVPREVDRVRLRVDAAGGREGREGRTGPAGGGAASDEARAGRGARRGAERGQLSAAACALRGRAAPAAGARAHVARNCAMRIRRNPCIRLVTTFCP